MQSIQTGSSPRCGILCGVFLSKRIFTMVFCVQAAPDHADP